MTDLTWVKQTMVVKEDDPDAKRACFDNPGWHLLLVTGGLYGPVEYVFGWGTPDQDSL